MTRPKGLPKTGGRKAGSPNKVTADLKSWIQQLIDGNRRGFERDLKKLEPKDRLVILERLMGYVVPKQQSVSVEEQVRLEYGQIERLLDEMPEQAVSELFERIKKLRDGQKGEN